MDIEQEDRIDINGRFIPGKSGNPRGRPEKEPTAEDILQAALSEAVIRLIDLVHSEDEAIALQAATVVIDRVLGKPKNPRIVNVKISPDNISDMGRALAYANIYSRK